MVLRLRAGPAQGLNGGLNSEAERLRSGDLFDPATGKSAGRHVGASPRGLLASLMVRAGALAPLPPAPPAAAKRPRGRPRKQDVAELAAKVWDEVTDGDGVVLQDGKPVRATKDLK